MTTSGVESYNPTLGNIISQALTHIGVIGLGDATPPRYYNFAKDVANVMIKSMQTMGLNLWLKQDAFVFQVLNQQDYDLMATGTHACTDFVQTTSTAATALSATTIVLTSVTGMSTSDNIGIVLSTGVLFWTTITNINTGTLTVTVNNALTATTTSGTTVFTYAPADAIGRVLDIQECNYRYNNGTERPMDRYSEKEFMEIPVKGSINPGTPVLFQFRRLEDKGQLGLWPVPTTTGDLLRIKYTRVVQDFVSVTDTMDFPPEWIECIILNLALRLAPVFDKESKASKLVAPLANQSLANTTAWDVEHVKVQFTPTYNGK